MSIHFGFRARHEQRQLTWGDVEYKLDLLSGRESIEWKTERVRKRIQGNVGEHRRTFSPIVFATGTEACLIKLFKIYRDRRPATMLQPDSPFFLQTDHKRWKTSGCWFKETAAGENRLGNILTVARKKYGFQGRKVANHSVRKTGFSRLLDSNLPDTYVAQQQGMKSTDSLKSYKAPGEKHLLQISHTLDRYDSAPKPSQAVESSTITKPTQAVDFTRAKIDTQIPKSPRNNVLQLSQVNQITNNINNIISPSSSPIDSGIKDCNPLNKIIKEGSFSNCKGCTFNFNFGSSKQDNNKVAKKRRRKRVIIDSSSEEENSDI